MCWMKVRAIETRIAREVVNIYQALQIYLGSCALSWITVFFGRESCEICFVSCKKGIVLLNWTFKTEALKLAIQYYFTNFFGKNHNMETMIFFQGMGSMSKFKANPDLWICVKARERETDRQAEMIHRQRETELWEYQAEAQQALHRPQWHNGLLHFLYK